MSPRPQLSPLAFLPVAVAAALYLPTLGHGIVWDDIELLPELSRAVESGDGAGAATRALRFSPNYFRPLPLLTLLAEIAAAGGVRPGLHHAVNVALHALNTALVMLLARRLAPATGRPAVLAGLLFAVHPALVEGVAFVSSRFDLLVTTFALSALLADASILQVPARCAAVGLCVLLATACKENAAALLLAIPALQLARCGTGSLSPREVVGGLRSGGHLPVLAATLASLLVAAVLRYAALGHLLTAEGTNPVAAGDAMSHALLVGRSAGTFLLLAVFPFGNLAPIHGCELPVPVTDAAAWAGLAATLAAVALAVRLVLRRPVLGWSAVAAAALLLPVLNLVPLELMSEAYTAERYLVLPLAVGVIPAALALDGALRRRAVRWAAAGFGLAAAATVVVTLGHWRDAPAFWGWAALHAPHTATPHINLALELASRGDHVGAEAAARRAVEVEPGSQRAWNNLGHSMIGMQRYEEAIDCFERAVDLDPGHTLAWSNLGRSLLEIGRWQDAERVLVEEALRRDPDHALATFNLAELRLREGLPGQVPELLGRALPHLGDRDREIARRMLEQANDPMEWLVAAQRRAAARDPEGARAALDEALRRGASPTDVRLGRVFVELRAGELDAAAALLAEIERDAPADPQTHNALGELARARGDITAAREHFRRAAALAPDWQVPRRALDALPPR